MPDAFYTNQKAFSWRNDLAMATFFYICDYLGVAPKEFFDLEAQNPGKIGDICEKMKRLNDDQLKIIETMIDQIK